MMVNLYKILFKQSLKETLMYKTTTVLTVIFGILFYIIDLIVGVVYFSFSSNIYGWKLINYFNLVTTTNLISYGYQFLFVAAHENLADEILDGNLDQYLIKPINSFIFYIIYRVDFASMINFIVAAIVEGVIFTVIKINLINLLIYIVYIVLGIIFLFAINQIATTLTFWFPNLTAILGIPEYLMDIGARPAQIYPRIIQNIFSLLIPILLITNVPVKNCTGHLNLIAATWILIIDLVLIAAAYIEWNKGLTHYESAN